MEEKDKKNLTIIIFVVLAMIFFTFILPVILYINNHQGDNINTDSLFKDNQLQEKSSENAPQTNDEPNLEEVNVNEDESKQENQTKPDYNDPFYKEIKKQLERQKYMPEITIPRDYYPGDNYIKNAANENGEIHVFKKQPILIYVPRGEYYDAITQAFVAYNNQFKGLIEFNTVKDPKKANIKIVLSEDLGTDTDVHDVIGVGRPLQFDKDGNILYSELKILTKDNYNGEKMPMIIVYNTVLHEIGHAMGILGHSPEPEDVMYKEISRKYHHQLKQFSDRDIETYKIMYSGRPALIANVLKGVKEEKLKENISYALDTNDADSYLAVADSYYAMGDYSKSLDAYKKALQLNPNNFRVYLGLAQCYLEGRQYDYALTYAKYALKRAQTYEQKSICNQIAGVALLRQENYMEAYTYLNSALLLQPENPDHFYNYILICRILNRRDLASDAYSSYSRNIDMNNYDEEQMEIINWAKY